MDQQNSSINADGMQQEHEITTQHDKEFSRGKKNGGKKNGNQQGMGIGISVSNSSVPATEYSINMRNQLKNLYYQNSDDEDRSENLEKAKDFVASDKIEKNLLS
ncbi:hypothetical protein PACTADRAFT_3632 [Pachysolen tannophilus NRRL Y-2460]|uniref:Uncharacterized protein n=1 Tax=Pachysolen tannophilus NRRL Y-2460 TaxID=669874 RepID=A0A1E4TSL2_PACTA|nr:hypothetical protein PACTADRAFT_3632 [Pachysolen tannophilus NRRL Y-2460]